jgi:predicted nuclease of predicted toxin-antitoxin system
VRFFIDECISPSLSGHLNESGLHDAIHPRDRGRLRDSDRHVFALAIREDRIIVTEAISGSSPRAWNFIPA